MAVNFGRLQLHGCNYGFCRLLGLSPRQRSSLCWAPCGDKRLAWDPRGGVAGRNPTQLSTAGGLRVVLAQQGTSGNASTSLLPIACPNAAGHPPESSVAVDGSKQQGKAGAKGQHRGVNVFRILRALLGWLLEALLSCGGAACTPPAALQLLPSLGNPFSTSPRWFGHDHHEEDVDRCCRAHSASNSFLGKHFQGCFQKPHLLPSPLWEQPKDEHLCTLQPPCAPCGPTSSLTA